jgi:YegS/Rv2252/BmrU family lipid kinase
MTSTFTPGSKAFIVINPVAGSTESQQLKKVCEDQFRAAGWEIVIHFTKRNENLDEVIKKALTTGFDLVVAVGGDGTVAAVAACLIHTRIPLGIIPTGTWNAIARHLTLPASPQNAIALITGKHTTRKLDMMAVDNTVHAMNIGVGFSGNMIKDSDRQQKNKLGNLVYIKNIFKQLFGLQMHQYVIQADGKRYKGRATEIFVANYGIVGLRFLEDHMNIHPDDGLAEIFIIKARTILDLPQLIWQVFVKPEQRTPKYRKISAVKRILITTIPPVFVQADGELLGMTPVNVKVLPKIIRVIAP